MQRKYDEEVFETFAIEDLEAKKSKLYSKDKLSVIDPNAQYVLIYYWTPDVMDKDFMKNYDYFFRYAKSHPELRIQVLPVWVN